MNTCNDKNCKGYGKPLIDRGYGYPVCETTPQKKTDKTLQLRKWKHQKCQETPRKGAACITPDGNKYASDVYPELNCISCRYNWVKIETQSAHPARNTGDYIPAKQVTCTDCGQVINVPENWMKYDIGCSCGAEVKV